MAGRILIQNAGALALMSAAAGELEEVGHVPDELLLDRDLLDHLADAALELTEPYLARHEIGAARLEHAPIGAGETLGQELQKRGLAHQLLAAHQERAHRRLQQRGLGGGERRVPAVRFDQALRLLRIPPEAAERSQKRMIDIALLDRVEPADERGRQRMIDAFQKRLDDGGGRGGLRIERPAELGGVAELRALDEIIAEQL
jgi:hypothetical protein